MVHRRSVPALLLVLLVIALALVGCAGGAAPEATQPPAAQQAAPTAMPPAPVPPTPVPAQPPTAAPTQPAPTSMPAPTTASPAAPATLVPPTTGPAAAAPRELIVFAAASLTESFNDLGKQFEAANPGVRVVLNYAGSQQLSAQLVQGAPADVFASANAKEMLTAVKGGTVVSGTQKVFARNRLAVIFPKDNPAKIGKLADLAKPGLKLDLADKSVPVGQYTLDMLAKMSKDPAYGANFQADVLKNVVSYENDVKVVVSKVTLDEADAGVVYTTDAGAAANKLGSLEVPNQFNQIATYPIAPIAKAPQPELAGQFVAFVLSPAGQKTLASYGFITNPAVAPASTAAPTATTG